MHFLSKILQPFLQKITTIYREFVKKILLSAIQHALFLHILQKLENKKRKKGRILALVD